LNTQYSHIHIHIYIYTHIYTHTQAKEKSGSTPLAAVGTALEYAGSFFKVLGLALSKYDDTLAFNPASKPNLSFSGQRRTVVFPNIRLSYVNM